MKTITFLFMLLALTWTTLVAQKEPLPAFQQGRQTLLDFRIVRNSAPPKIPLATQRTVLSKVFRKYLTDESKCNPDLDLNSADDALAAARSIGQFVPSIADVVTGSFTAPGQTQTAYVIFVAECNASHADNFGTKRIAIFSGQQLIADLDLDFKGGIARKTDLNSDGVDELLMTSGDIGQGTLIEMAALVEFRNGRRRVIEDFGTVVEDSCASETPGSSAKASLLSISDVAPGQMPKLRIDNYVSSCRKVRRWRFLSTGKMPD